MYIRFALMVASLVWIVAGSNMVPILNGQEKSLPTPPDWVTSMPVSMNGKLPTSSFWFEGLELRRWHNSIPVDESVRKTWHPEMFFDDPLVISLCNAIFEQNIVEMKRLIENGANVKKVGKDGMTPLYWAFHVESDPRPFELLITSGADPNVIVSFSDEYQPYKSILSGYSVTNLVGRGLYNRQFKNVFEHGGDPNLENENDFSGIPAFKEIWADAPDSVERLQLMIDKGANLDWRHPELKTTFVMGQVGKYENHNRLALVALKGGANYQFYYKQRRYSRDKPGPYNGCYFRLIHILAVAEAMVGQRPANQQTHFRAVVAWLEEHDESLANAKDDLKRWKEWIRTGQTELIEKEHRSRLAKDEAKTKLP